METKSPSREPGSGLGLDAEPGSGAADPEDREFGRGNPIARKRESSSASNGLRPRLGARFRGRDLRPAAANAFVSTASRKSRAFTSEIIVRYLPIQ